MHLDTPFNMIIVGMTGCGKTYYLLTLLETEYEKQFENIFVICPTFVQNRTYREWKYVNDECFFAIPCDHDEVERYLKEVTNHAEGTNSLIVLDDCASSKSVKNRTSELVRLGFSARHYGLSTIVLTQQLTSITKPYRENISKLVTFYNPSSKDMNTIFDDYLSTLDDSEKNAIVSAQKTTTTRDLKFCFEDHTHTRWSFRRKRRLPNEVREREATERPARIPPDRKITK